MEKPAEVQFHIHDLLRRRWSPRAFADQPVEREKIQKLLEAARWAPSCFNEQPWVFILATIENPENHQKLLSCLVEGNQIWAKRAPLLLLTVAKLHFDHNGQVNRHAYHDVGLAVGNLVMQATAMDLAVHQMAGILPDTIRERYALPTGYEAVTGIAIGYQGNVSTLPESLRERELAPRSRKSLREFVFSEIWGGTPECL
ncbi:MAG: nitroreductase family protein [Nitrospira sp.]|nr:nitroreductase family protein [Nitrospira sp.]HNP29036.1 nitroreductase family protein [Nitrospirales bacterium]